MCVCVFVYYEYRSVVYLSYLVIVIGSCSLLDTLCACFVNRSYRQSGVQSEYSSSIIRVPMFLPLAVVLL